MSMSSGSETTVDDEYEIQYTNADSLEAEYADMNPLSLYSWERIFVCLAVSFVSMSVIGLVTSMSVEMSAGGGMVVGMVCFVAWFWWAGDGVFASE